MSYLEYAVKTVPSGPRKILYLNWPLVLLLTAVAAVGFLMLASVSMPRNSALCRRLPRCRPQEAPVASAGPLAGFCHASSRHFGWMPRSSRSIDSHERGLRVEAFHARGRTRVGSLSKLTPSEDEIIAV